MNIKQSKANGKLTVYIEGNIDTSTAPTVQEYLAKEMGGAKELVIDFSKVEYISSAGLRVLLFAQKSMKKQGGSLLVVHVNSDIMETLELTCFTDIINIQK